MQGGKEGHIAVSGDCTVAVNGGMDARCGQLTPHPVDALFFFQAEDGIRDIGVTGVQTCLPISQTSTERILTSWMPAAVMASMWLSSIMVPWGTMIEPSAATRSSAVERPRMRVASDATTWPASIDRKSVV